MHIGFAFGKAELDEQFRFGRMRVRADEDVVKFEHSSG
jgi:hypothetical protein